MASVKHEKTSSQKFYSSSYAIHFDTEKRKSHGHNNPDIDTTQSEKNTFYRFHNFDEIKERVRQVVATVDEKYPPMRIKEDRKIVDAMNIPCPKPIEDAGKEKEFFDMVDELMYKTFGNRYCGATVHYDEKHTYAVKKGEDGISERESLYHMNAWVVPIMQWTEHKPEKINKRSGKVTPAMDIQRHGINMKHFATADTFNMINNLINDACLERFNLPFMDGSKAKDKRTIEEIKAESAKLARIKADKELEDTLSKLETTKQDYEEVLTKKIACEEEKSAIEQTIGTRQTALMGVEEDITAKMDELTTIKAQIQDLTKDFDKKSAELEESLKSAKMELTRTNQQIEKAQPELEKITKAEETINKMGREIRLRKRILDTTQLPKQTMTAVNVVVYAVYKFIEHFKDTPFGEYFMAWFNEYGVGEEELEEAYKFATIAPEKAQATTEKTLEVLNEIPEDELAFELKRGISKD